jgi:hypothetical protein
MPPTHVRKNLESSAIAGAVAALVVALVAAIDPATPWSSVGLRAAIGFVAGAGIGLTLSAATYVLLVLRRRDDAASPVTSSRLRIPADPAQGTWSKRLNGRRRR